MKVNVSENTTNSSSSSSSNNSSNCEVIHGIAVSQTRVDTFHTVFLIFTPYISGKASEAYIYIHNFPKLLLSEGHKV